MGEIGGKLRKPRKRILEPVQHVVESDRERLKLARPAGGRHALIQMGRADPFERLGHFSERPQTALRDRDSDHRRGENAACQHNDEQNPEFFRAARRSSDPGPSGLCNSGRRTSSEMATNEKITSGPCDNLLGSEPTMSILAPTEKMFGGSKRSISGRLR